MQLLQAVEDVYNGDVAYDCVHSQKGINRFSNVFYENNQEISLTPREKEVLVFLAKGHSHKMVASALYIKYSYS